jgi:hypothetical protein
LDAISMRAPPPCARVDRLHRRGEVEHVEVLGLVRSDLRVHEVEHDVARFAAQVHRRARAIEADDDAAFAILAAAEVHVGDLERGGVGDALGRVSLRRGGSRRGRADHAVIDGDDDIVARHARLVTRGAEQIDDDAGAASRLERGNGGCRSRADVDALLAHRVARVREV